MRAFWAEEFKNDPPGQTEIFHVGGTGCVRQEIYVVGMTQAAIDTGHPIKFTQSTDDETPEQ